MDDWSGSGFVAFVSATVGAVGAAIVARIKKAPEVQTVTNAAVAGIIQHYTNALTEQTVQVVAMRAELSELKTTVETQHDEIAELNDYILDLSDALRRAGVPQPPRRRRGAAVAAAALKEVAATAAADLRHETK